MFMQHYQFFSINITMAEFAKNVIISEANHTNCAEIYATYDEITALINYRKRRLICLRFFPDFHDRLHARSCHRCYNGSCDCGCRYRN